MFGAIAWFLGVASCSAPSRAQRVQDARHRPITITLVGSGAQLSELAQLLKAWEPSLNLLRALHVRTLEIFDTGSMGVNVWLLPLPGWGAKLYFVDAVDKRFLVREVPLASGLDESGREILAQVVANSAQAFLDGEARSTRLELESSLRADQAQPLAPFARERQRSWASITGKVVLRSDLQYSSRSAWTILPSLFYAVQMVSSSHVAQGPGISIGVARDYGLWRWTGAARGQYRFPVGVELTGARLELRSWAAGVTTAVQRVVSSGGVVGTELGVLIARTQFELDQVSVPTIEATPKAVHYQPSAYAGVSVGHDLVVARLALLLGGEISLVKTHYDIGSTTVFRPWLVAPRIALEAAWE